MPGMCARRKRRSQRRDRSVSARVITVTPPPTVTDSGPSVALDNPAEPDLGEVMSANMCVRPAVRVADRDGRYRVGWDRSCRTNQSDAPTIAGTTTTPPRTNNPAPMFAPVTGAVATA